MSENILFEIFVYISTTALLFGTVYFLYVGMKFRRESLTACCLVDYPVKRHKNISTTIENIIHNRKLLSSTKLTQNEKLFNSAADLGIGNIEFLLYKIINTEKKIHIFCINKGGALISTYLAHRLHLDPKYLVKCDYNKRTDKIYCEERQLSTPIILIDDVARTGKTLSKVKKHLKIKYPNVPVFCFVLVDASGNSDETSEHVVDYAPWVTNNKDITFQWSPWSGADMIEKPLKDDRRFFNLLVKEYFNDTAMDQIVERIKSLEVKTKETS